MDINKLVEALNNPNSPAAMQLLDYLSNSPLDPAAAFQQLTQAQQPTQLPPLPGGAQAPMGDSAPPIGQVLNPQAPMQQAQMAPGVNPGSQGPWSFNYSSPNNGAVMTDPNNPNFVPPAAAQAAGMNPNATLVQGEPALPGMGGIDPRILEGLLGMAEEEPVRPPMIAGGGGGPGPREVQMQQLQLPQAGRIPSLAELLRGV